MSDRFGWRDGDVLVEDPVEKHGNHDQEDHGNWSRGPKPERPSGGRIPSSGKPVASATQPEYAPAYAPIRSFEDNVRSEPREHLLAVTVAGDEVWRTTQTDLLPAGDSGVPNAAVMTNGIEVPPDIAPRLAGTVLTHNHPSGFALSTDDYITMRALDIAEVRVARRGDGTTRASITAKARSMSVGMFGAAVKDANRTVYARLGELVQDGSLLPDDAQRVHYDLVAKELARRGLVDVDGIQRSPFIGTES